MPPNPLTPPSEYSTEAIITDPDNGATTIVSGPNDYTSQQFATPMSTVGMGSESAEGCESMENRPDLHYMSDEDQDMSDGGAELTMTLSHAEQLNAELDLLDAEVMGHDNLVGLLLENHYPSIAENHFQYSDSFSSPGHYSDESPDQSEEVGDAYMQGTTDAASLPTSLSAVSLQLQHLQDGQEHDESAELVDELHGAAFINNSTPSILLPFFSSPAASNLNHGNAPPSDFVSLGDITLSNSPAEPPNVPLLAGTDGWAHPFQSPTPHSLLLNLPTFPWDNDSDADPNEVDDQSNLGLGEFLYNWGVSTSLAEESRKRPRGPALPALYKQRSEKLLPVHISDLHGDRCDLQRINWKELGVSRLEARQMRRSTYRNYTNLGFSHQWHVSRSYRSLRLSFYSNIISHVSMAPDYRTTKTTSDSAAWILTSMSTYHISNYETLWPVPLGTMSSMLANQRSCNGIPRVALVPTLQWI
jgi:hypothetical protein